MKECNERILQLLEDRSSLKQKVFKNSKEYFAQLKATINKVAGSMQHDYCRKDESVEVNFSDKNEFEAEILFGGDVLIFHMHTNVFTFDRDHNIWSNSYIKEDRKRAYFCMINIYNFLADSFRFNRVNDTGVLLGRIFVNHEGHFFMEGRRQLGFLFNDVVNQKMDEAYLVKIVETAIIHAIEYDLTAPELKDSMITSVGRVMKQSSELIPITAKKLGYRLYSELKEE